LSAEPETGTELQRRGETLPDVSVAHRAGSIVTEFVSSIVDEAQARGTEIMAEAEQDVRSRREAAGAGAARIHERVETVAPGLAALLETLRREAATLSGEEPEPETALPPRLTPSAGQKPEQGEPEPAVEQEPERPDEPGVVEAIVVEDDDITDDATAGMTPSEQNGVAAEADDRDDPRVRVSRMTDEELARCYTNAARALHSPGVDDGYAEQLRALAGAAVEEALQRPAFEEKEPEQAGGLMRRAGARRRRRRALVLAELREACRQTREQQVASGAPGA
jgi:hypothetical protein